MEHLQPVSRQGVSQRKPKSKDLSARMDRGDTRQEMMVVCWEDYLWPVRVKACAYGLSSNNKHDPIFRHFPISGNDYCQNSCNFQVKCHFSKLTELNKGNIFQESLLSGRKCWFPLWNIPEIHGLWLSMTVEAGALLGGWVGFLTAMDVGTTF